MTLSLFGSTRYDAKRVKDYLQQENIREMKLLEPSPDSIPSKSFGTSLVNKSRKGNPTAVVDLWSKLKTNGEEITQNFERKLKSSKKSSPAIETNSTKSDSPAKPTNCSVCSKNLRWIWSKKIQCEACLKTVCQDCVTPPTSGKSLCLTCSKESGPKGLSPDQVDKQVRDHVETVVSSHLGGCVLDDALAVPDTKHSLWSSLFSSYHSLLSQTLVQFCGGLRKAIQNEPLSPQELPSTLHSSVKARLNRVVRSAGKKATHTHAYKPITPTITEMERNNYSSETYEDLLATAVLNKVLEKVAPEGNEKDDVGPTIVVVEHGSTDTDSGMSGSGNTPPRPLSETDRNSSCSSSCGETNIKRESCESPPMTHRDEWVVSPDQGVDVGGSKEDLVDNMNHTYVDESDDSSIQFKIEEHIEEITTHHFPTRSKGMSDDSSSFSSLSEEGERDAHWGEEGNSLSSEDNRASPSQGVSGSWHKEKTQGTSTVVLNGETVPALSSYLPPPGDMTPRRIPFPEMGGDLLHWYVESDIANEESDPAMPGDVIMDPESWQDNWLFKKQKLALRRQDCVAMLIPQCEGGVSATVGDRDIDELSDLSEISGRCSSLSSVASDDEIEDCLDRTSFYQSEKKDLRTSKTTHSNQPSSESPSSLLKPPSRAPKFPADSSTLLTINDSLVGQNNTNHDSRKSSSSRHVSKSNKGESGSEVTKTQTVSFIERPDGEVCVADGRAIRLNCTVDAHGPIGVSWFKNGSLLRPNSSVISWREDSSTHHLVVLPSGSNTSPGEYSVAAYTLGGECTFSFCRVQVKESSRVQQAPKVIIPLHKLVETLGNVTQEFLALEIQVTGHPEPSVTFYIGDSELNPGANCFIENDKYGTWQLRVLESVTNGSEVISARVKNCLGSEESHWNGMTETIAVPVKQVEKNKSKNKTQNAQQNCNRRGSTREVKETDDLKKESTEERDYEDDEIFISAPKPGTIAEREHRKWQEAPSIGDNPYSARRLSQRLASAGGRAVTTEHGTAKFSRDVSDSETTIVSQDLPNESRRDLTRYTRDYYVKESPSTKFSPSKKTILSTTTNISSTEPFEMSSKKDLNSSVHIPEALENQSADWKEECNSNIKPAIVEKERSRIEHSIDSSAKRHVYRPLSCQRKDSFTNGKDSYQNRKEPLQLDSSKRHLIYSSQGAIDHGVSSSASGLWRTMSVDDGLQVFSAKTNENSSYENPRKDLVEETPDAIDYYSEDMTQNHHDYHSESQNRMEDYRIHYSQSSGLRQDACYHDNDSSGRIEDNNGYNSEASSTSLYLNPLERSYSVDDFHMNSLHEISNNGSQYHSMLCFDGSNSVMNEEHHDKALTQLELPSVRDLATRFDSLKRTNSETFDRRKYDIQKTNRKYIRNGNVKFTESSTPCNRNVRGWNVNVTRPYKMNQVHSLTARSVPRSFREDLKNNRPVQANRNIPVVNRENQLLDPSLVGRRTEEGTVCQMEIAGRCDVECGAGISNYTPMESTYYNFTDENHYHPSYLPRLESYYDYSGSEGFYHAGNHNNFGNSNQGVNVMRSNSSVTEITIPEYPLEEAVDDDFEFHRDASGSPDHLGIPGNKVTLVPHHHHHRRCYPGGDTSDESSSTISSPPRHTRRGYRVGYGGSGMKPN